MMIMNDHLGKIWMEAVIPYFKALTTIVTENGRKYETTNRCK
jgi:hypothetical protein